MRVNYGKPFEERFKTQWGKAYPNTLVLRLPDNMSGYYGVSNPCDFVCFPGKHLYMIETKAHYENRLPWDAFSQYDSLVKYIGMKNVIAGVMIWFIDHDRVIFVPIESCKKMRDNGLKAINIRKLEGYEYIEVPSKKLRVFMDSDYTIMEDYYGKESRD